MHPTKGLLAIAVIAVAGATVSGLATKATPAAAPQQVRMSWQEFAKDPRRVASFIRGIEVMKSRNTVDPSTAAYRGSWQYWAAMHSYYGKESSNGPVAAGIAFLQQLGLGHFADRYKGIPDLVPPDALAREVWDGCRHSGFDQNEQLVPQNFFGWHRLYLYYFERVLRAAAQDDTLRLPYWDYTDRDQRQLPAGFGTINGKPVNPVLFDEKRASGLNDGTELISEMVTNVDAVLQRGTFEGINGFAWGIEGGIHGDIHCIVGADCPVPYMGDVAVSANDPVFWLHHVNIDRLFECWMEKHKKKPGGSVATDAFVFVDETGTRRERGVAEFLDAANLEYRYDNTADCMRPAPGPSLTTNIPQTQPAAGTTVAIANGVSLTKPVMRVTLPLQTSPQTGESNQAVAKSIESADALDLLIGNISFDKAPGTMFAVYLGRPGAPASERAYVGTISFFGAGRGHHGKPGPITRSFDVTAQAKAIAAKMAANAGNLEVTFEATTGRVLAPGAAAGPAIPPEPKVPTTIGRVELRTRTKP